MAGNRIFIVTVVRVKFGMDFGDSVTEKPKVKKAAPKKWSGQTSSLETINERMLQLEKLLQTHEQRFLPLEEVLLHLHELEDSMDSGTDGEETN